MLRPSNLILAAAAVLAPMAHVLELPTSNSLNAQTKASTRSGEYPAAAVWLRVTHVIAQLVNMTPPGPVH